MEDYIQNYDSFKIKVVYDFNITSGGIGDCLKFFMFALHLCIQYKYKLHYLVHNIPIEKYIKLKYPQMYIDDKNIKNKCIVDNATCIPTINNNCFNIIYPNILYSSFNYEIIHLHIQNVFYFSNEVIINSKTVLQNINNYISIHLRLGDKYLEIPKQFIGCIDDERSYNENKLYEFIEKNYNKNMIFFCDNYKFKCKIKEKYNNIHITNCEIGHTSLSNTTDKQTLDAVTEFYLMTESDAIYCASYSGFSHISSKFKNIPLINIY
jgi:hypothetical protein